MPFVTGPGTPSPETLGILFAEFIAPASDRFLADHHSACSHHLFYIAEAHAETKVVPNAFRDDFFREPMAAIQVVRHSSSIAAARSGQCDNALRAPSADVRRSANRCTHTADSGPRYELPPFGHLVGHPNFLVAKLPWESVVAAERGSMFLPKEGGPQRAPPRANT
jgi:hypothetical protein